MEVAFELKITRYFLCFDEVEKYLERPVVDILKLECHVKMNVAGPRYFTPSLPYWYSQSSRWLEDEKENTKRNGENSCEGKCASH